MAADNCVVSFCAALLLLIECAATTSAAPMASAAPGNAQITVLYDAFGNTSTMQKDWGYAALVEYGGKMDPVRHWQQPSDPCAERESKGH